MSKEYRELYREIVVKVDRRRKISMEEIDKLIEFAFNEGYNQCMLDDMEVEKLVKEIENEREINE